MSEKLTPKYEKGPEKNQPHKGVEKSGELESLRRNPENSAEKPDLDRQKNIEKAHRQLEQEQTEQHRGEKPSEKKETESSQVLSRTQKRAAYKAEMKKVQRQLPPSARVFSKVVHNPVVEVVSDVAAETVLRPSFLIVGGVCGLIFGGGLYIIAQIQGFTLPNSQFVIAFIAGGLIGVLAEFIIRIFTPKKH